MNAGSLSLSLSVFSGVLAALASCGGSAQEQRPPPPPAVSTPSAHQDDGAIDAAVPDAEASAAFAPLRDRVLDELLADDPSTARDLGLHEYDGKVASVSK